MSFSSISFFLYLGILHIVCLYLPGYKRLILLLSSLLFISFFSLYDAIILLLLCTIVYIILLASRHRKSILLGSKRTDLSKWLIVITCLGILILSRYISKTGILPTTISSYTLEIVGISYLSFSLIGISLDILNTRSDSKATCPSYLDFLFATLFFAKIPQGPILRLSDYNQLDLHRTSRENYIYAFLSISYGLFLKTVLADRIGIFLVDPYFFSSESYLFHLLSPLSYYFQLYFDFEGYMRIALGAAALFGYRLPENFNNPILAISSADFWRRWHMTLSSFIRDFLFTPLSFGFRNTGILGVILSTILVFAIVGLWHGYGLPFLLFGIFHGIWMSFESLIRFYFNPGFQRRFKGIALQAYLIYLRIQTTILVSISLIFFKSKNLSESFDFVTSLLYPSRFVDVGVLFDLHDTLNILVVAILSCTALFWMSFSTICLFPENRQVFLACILVLVVFGLGITSSSSFIYFRF